MDDRYKKKIDKGDWHYHYRDFVAALKEYEQAIVMDTSCPVGYCKRGLVYCELKKYDLAKQDLNNARGLKLNHAVECKFRGDLACRLDKYDEAIQDYARAIKFKPELAADCKEKLPREFHQKFEELVLISKHDRAVDANPKNATAYFERGNLYFKLKRYDEAISDYARAIELKPELSEDCQKNLPSDFYQRVEKYLKDANVYTERGKAHLKQENYDEAIRDFNQAVAVIKANCAEAYNNLGIAHYKAGKYNEAIQDFSESVKLKPDYAEAYNNRGDTYYSKKNYEQAIEDYTAAVMHNPKFFEAYNNLGLAHYNSEKYDLAIQDYSEAIKIFNNYAPAYYNRACAYDKLGDKGKAIRDYAKAVELNWSFKKDLPAEIQEKIKLVEELDKFNRAVELNSSDANAYNNRGVVHCKLEEYDAAIKDFNKAIELKADFAEAYNNRGLAYCALEKYLQAIQDFAKALQLNPSFAEALKNLCDACEKLKAQ